MQALSRAGRYYAQHHVRAHTVHGICLVTERLTPEKGVIEDWYFMPEAAMRSPRVTPGWGYSVRPADTVLAGNIDVITTAVPPSSW